VPAVDVTTWYLEMTSPEQLAPAPPPRPGIEVRRAEVPSPELSRWLYATVGAEWWWLDRRGWDLARWGAHVARPEVETWLAYDHGTPAGYAELEGLPTRAHLAYLGLLPGFLGRGIGTRLLDAALRRAWVMTDPPPARVTVNTCSLDSAHALRTYEARGFTRVREARTRVSLPERPLVP
jgi:GNAT superfamily N-acetyltransferase